MKFSNFFWIGLILIFFLATRLYKIDRTPASVYWDEASIGVNAYSILKTGRDEWGQFLPLHFRAFGEFKLPVYIYATVFSESLFGLTELAVRLPAVIFSSLALIVIFLLSWQMTGFKLVGFLSAFILSLSPWFFLFSRTGFEAVAGLLFFYLGLLFFWIAKKNNNYLILFGLSFVISMYAYNSYRIIAPISFLFCLIFLFKDKLNKKKLVSLILTIFIFITALFPITKLYIYDSGLVRAQNLRIDNVSVFAKNYLSHFKPDFLIFNGDKNPRSHVAGAGEVYMIDVVLIIFGLIYLFRTKKTNAFFPASLLLISFIPAALFKENPHALRSLTAAPTLAMLSGIGSFWAIKRYKIFLFVIPILYLAFFANYYINFLNNYSRVYSQDWQYSYKVLFRNYKDIFPSYNQVIVSSEYAQPYIFGLFYMRVEPEDFRQTVRLNKMSDWGFSTVSEFGKFKFGKIYDNMIEGGRTIIFATPREKLKGVRNIGEIRNLDNSVAFLVYEITK